MGRPRSSPLAPILRSDAQARVLAAVLLSPESLHVRAIADRIQLPYSVVQREIDRLEDARLVKSSRFQTARVVRPNEAHPLYPELRALLLKAYGPQYLLSDLLLREPGSLEAYIFGSWADRYHGNWGAEWGDVDVAVIGKLSPARVEELESQAEDVLGWPVQITVIAPGTWRDATEPFIKTVQQRPLVPLELNEQ